MLQKISGFLRLIRFVNLLIIALGLSLFYYLIIVPVHKNQLHTTLVPFSNFEFVLFVLSVVLVAAAGYIINDYFDFELDKIYKPHRPLPQAVISLDAAMYVHAAFAFTGIALGFYLGWKIDYLQVGYLYIVCILLLYAYSAWLKKIPLAGNIVIAALAGFVFVLLIIFEAAYLKAIHANNLFDNTGFVFSILTWQMNFYAGFAFLCNLAREIVKGLEDRDGDAAFNVNTIAVQFGIVPAKIAEALVLLVLLGSIGFFMFSFYNSGNKGEFYYLLVAVALPVLITLGLLFSAGTVKDYGRISILIKLIMLAGILSIPAFYLIQHATNA